MAIRRISGFRQKSQLSINRWYFLVILNTVEKLSSAVCSSPPFSPQQHALQNKISEITSLNFFFPKYRDSRELILTLPVNNKTKKNTSNSLPISVLCQFSASSAKLLSIQSFFETTYVFWEKDERTHTLVHFCSVRRVLLRSAERRRSNEPRHLKNVGDTQPQLTPFFQIPINIPRYTDQFNSTALTRKKAEQVVVELQPWMTGILKKKKKTYWVN